MIFECVDNDLWRDPACVGSLPKICIPHAEVLRSGYFTTKWSLFLKVAIQRN